MIKKIWHCSSLQKQDEFLVYEKLLPKGWFPTDFSPTENLIEIQDTIKGDRFWLDPKELFHHPCPPHIGLEFSIGQEILVWKMRDNARESIASTYILKEFSERIFRKRCYLQVLFEPVPDSEREFDFMKEAHAGINV